MPQSPPSQTAGKSASGTKRPLVLASVMIAMFISAIEATIVATAMPSIVADLGGFSLFSWVFSGFLLMQAIFVPIYGKLADLFGRKPVFYMGVAVFLIGSILCGFAGSMTQLIIFRFIQGIGAGAIQPIAMTIVGDIYTIEERGKIQGYLASVWGFASVVGPTLGGIFVEYVHWSWVFWVNIPLGIISILGLTLFLHERVEKKPHSIDYPGSALLFVAISALMVLLIQGGVHWPWVSAPVLLLTIVSLIGIVLFFLRENRASEPIMPLSIWKNRLIALCNIGSLTTGIVMIGVSAFLPTFVQGVMERTPTTAGFVLAMMSVGWPLSSTIGGRFLVRVGFRRMALLGGFMLIIGSLFFLVLKPEQGPLMAGLATFLIGVGMGLSTMTYLVAVQSSVDWQTRGVATASNMFMRILGTTLGASILGGILNSRLNAFLLGHQDKVNSRLDISLTNQLLDPAARRQLAPSVVRIMQDGLTNALHSVYIGIFILAAVTLLLVLFLPKPGSRAEKKTSAKAVHT
ncbi:MDR family MFS transporter [Ferviditalea candida]|uniref:MDR family MFS transporter n=1 Tax=Ferviditalea candida TaxID=3108399 RepID=A0ABU5ZEF1_9BACL|nr:MDR family MFS transporter [Paenibacillaceae bacterium T2]